MPNHILHPGTTCGHCRSQQVGSAAKDGTPLCHPDDGPDCYRLVTVYGHALDGSCCADTPRPAELETEEHPAGCACDSGPCEGKGHAETMRREADTLHRMCDGPSDGLIRLPRTSPATGI